ncbi:MAG: PHP domain-containing protein, partial [Nitrospina sp.]|nr:PHP domain-containing protein [Nitrospina sp.]
MTIPLNCHSFYSLLRGTTSVESIVEKAVELNFLALALTDTNATYGVVAFQKSAISHGIRPIFGAEVDDPETGDHAVLLAKNLLGFGEVCRV